MKLVRTGYVWNCIPLRVVALHLLDKHGVHALLVEDWELCKSCLCVEISWKLEEIVKSASKRFTGLYKKMEI